MIMIMVVRNETEEHGKGTVCMVELQQQ